MSERRLVRLAWVAFLLIGWTGPLVPALLHEIETRFAVDDAAVGVWFFVTAAAYAAASFAGGLLTERIGRRLVLVSAATLMGIGLLLAATASMWLVFLAAAVPMGAGGGAIDGGMNAVVLAVESDRRGRALNQLHLFFSIGALSSPFVAGRVVGAGLAWPLLLAASGVVALAIAAAMWLTPMPSGRQSEARAGPTRPMEAEPGPRSVIASVRVPLALLAVAIACYVAAEIGVSNWIVGFLVNVPVETATFALSAFWAGLALGRLAGTRLGDRLSQRGLAAASSAGCGLAVFLAVAAPSPELAIAGFALAGFAAGPVFPLIMAIAGDLVPQRLSATSGTLTAAAVVGGMVYPPLIGFMSARVGIAVGLVGAGALALACGAAIVLAARRPAPAGEPA